jgi:lysozyme
MLARQWGRAALKVAYAISAAAVVALMGYEGFVATPYRDQAGVWTNGYGNTKGVTRYTPPVTKAQATADLEAHVDKFTDGVLAALTIPPTQGQLDAYVLLTYNIGVPAFAKSSAAQAHNAGHLCNT